MIAQYIQSLEAQQIANRIHYTNMVNQYDAFIGTPDKYGDPITPERIKEYWGATKLFLDCTEQEAIDQYSLVGMDESGYPLVDPLVGVTTAYATPSTVEGNENCIPSPENINDYDLTEFTYEVIDIDFPD